VAYQRMLNYSELREGWRIG